MSNLESCSLPEALKALRILTGHEDPKSEDLDEIINHRLELLCIITSRSTRIKDFTLTCLSLLRRMHALLNDFSGPGAPLGQRDLKALAILLGILVRWGIDPHMPMTLGLSGLDRMLFPTASDVYNPSVDLLLLHQVCSTFVTVITQAQPFFMSPGHLIVQHHLIPTFAGLLLLGYGQKISADDHAPVSSQNQLSTLFDLYGTYFLTL